MQVNDQNYNNLVDAVTQQVVNLGINQPQQQIGDAVWLVARAILDNDTQARALADRIANSLGSASLSTTDPSTVTSFVRERVITAIQPLVQTPSQQPTTPSSVPNIGSVASSILGNIRTMGQQVLSYITPTSNQNAMLFDSIRTSDHWIDEPEDSIFWNLADVIDSKIQDLRDRAGSRALGAPRYEYFAYQDSDQRGSFKCTFVLFDVYSRRRLDFPVSVENNQLHASVFVLAQGFSDTQEFSSTTPGGLIEQIYTHLPPAPPPPPRSPTPPSSSPSTIPIPTAPISSAQMWNQIDEPMKSALQRLVGTGLSEKRPLANFLKAFLQIQHLPSTTSANDGAALLAPFLTGGGSANPTIIRGLLRKILLDIHPDKLQQRGFFNAVSDADQPQVRDYCNSLTQFCQNMLRIVGQ